MLLFFQIKKATFTDGKIAATLSLQEADNLGCLRFYVFDFQLKFNLKYTNFPPKKN